MDERPTVSPRPWAMLPLFALLGSLLVAVGVLLPWAEVTSARLATSDFLEELATTFGVDAPTVTPGGQGETLSGPLADLSVPGRSDLLGVAAAAGAMIGIGGSLFAVGAPTARSARLAGWIVVGGGAVIVAAAVAALSDTDGFVLREIESVFREETDRQLSALFPALPFSGLLTGPIANRMIDALMASLSVGSVAAIGSYLTVVGGVIAVVVGVAVLVRERPGTTSGRATLVQMAAQLDPGVRADLLAALTTAEDARAEAARAFCEVPGREAWGGFVAEVLGDERVRRDVVQALQAGSSSIGDTT